ncbi:hypothetical protein F6X37_18315 [Paraburkholderia sp. 31.1]|uniref:hypothetical protein n=1 Tax=Paraburkholderia sp. 31.1 TaxID=2615205 RepID=UPI00165583F8|nr:hypothetical protein [Paraburkholderia sp. 31.1]MBC8723469.1 hypothetical protein [Paraburkholderia sp. 31.1]
MTLAMRAFRLASFSAAGIANKMPIKLAFQDERLRKVCESTVSAKRKYGEVAGPSIHARLADLRAANSPMEFVEIGFGRFDETVHDRIVIFIAGGYRMLAVANNRPPLGALGALDWAQVTRVKILSIERTHES